MADDDLLILTAEQLEQASPAERQQYRNYLIFESRERDDWQVLIPAIAPEFASAPFAEHHKLFWQWVWDIELDSRPRPFVGIWPRGGAKSTSVEMAVSMLGARLKRRYCLYVSETQEQADDHVGNVAAILEGDGMDVAFPEMGKRLVGKHGASKGWRRDRVRTGNGFTVDAIGLDSAGRGIKLEDMRPDLIVLDDIDGEHDGEAATAKKIKTITRKLLPAGSRNVAVIAIQNKVHDDSIFARLSDDRADFLRNRIVSGPIPAVWDLQVADGGDHWKIIGGTPSWPESKDLTACQIDLNDWGLSAYLAEAQHETQAVAGGMFDHLAFGGIQVSEAELPTLTRTVCWLDPAVTASDQSDCQGIQIDALGDDGIIYRLYSWEGRQPPLAAMKQAIEKALEWNAEIVGVETDQGGDTWLSVYHQACEELRREKDVDGNPKLGLAPKLKQRKASQGFGAKATRAQKMLVDYERFRIRHLKGTTHSLEMALMRFPKVKPFDLVDAAFWSWNELANVGVSRGRVRTAARRSLAPYTPSAN